MSLDTDAIDEQVTASNEDSRKDAKMQSDSYSDSEQWLTFREKIVARAKSSAATDVFGDVATNGNVYRWGIAVATGVPIDKQWQCLSRIACDGRVTKRNLSELDAVAATGAFSAATAPANEDLVLAANANLWAAALPGLVDRISHQQWWELLTALQSYRESALVKESDDSPLMQLLGAELGLTLAWRLWDIPSCKRLVKSSMDCMAGWYKSDEESIAAATKHGIHARLVLASLLRSRSIAKKVSRQKFKKQQLSVMSDLATWVASLTIHTGSSAFSSATRSDVVDDTRKGGLLDNAVECDPESLRPAMKAALGKSQSEGRLAWEVSLPEALQSCDDAKVAVMMPEWDVRRGRAHVDYSELEMSLELFAGKPCVIQGACQTSIEMNGRALKPLDAWSSICEYSDDDVQYMELEQAWSDGFVVQRQLLVVRDDRCFMLADSVLPSESRPKTDTPLKLNYCNRLPLPKAMQLVGEKETREMYLSDGKTRGLVLPLSASEWRVGPSAAALRQSDDQFLELTASGRERLYAPLWFDFQRRRFSRKRTWRQLTVAQDLGICDHSSAAGFRVQLGSEQWLIYRSLAERVCRSVMGKHLVADFYAGRFHAGDGSFEELVTVDDSEFDGN